MGHRAHLLLPTHGLCSDLRRRLRHKPSPRSTRSKLPHLLRAAGKHWKAPTETHDKRIAVNEYLPFVMLLAAIPVKQTAPSRHDDWTA
eukprot:12316-Eustigmatos_ZCMA.PRE.1